MRGSITEADALEHFVTATVARWGRIDGVVNNTGHPAKGDPLALTDADWENGYHLILESVFRLTRLTVPVMERQGAGAIVTILSYAAVRPDATRPVSSVFRAALSAWTRLMAERLAPHIRVNALLPGFVDTHAVDPATIATIPLGRPARASEIATAAEFLLSDAGSYITGQNIVIDGGMVHKHARIESPRRCRRPGAGDIESPASAGEPPQWAAPRTGRRAGSPSRPG